MVKKKSNNKAINLKINLSNKLFYTFLVVSALIVLGIGVYASSYVGSNGVGHDLSEIGFPSCASGQILEHNGANWICGDKGSNTIYESVPGSKNITSSQSFQVPAGVSELTIDICGGGGSGGAGSGASFASGYGGKQGECLTNQVFSTSPGDVLVITVGGGGVYPSSGGDSIIMEGSSELFHVAGGAKGANAPAGGGSYNTNGESSLIGGGVGGTGGTAGYGNRNHPSGGSLYAAGGGGGDGYPNDGWPGAPGSQGIVRLTWVATIPFQSTFGFGGMYLKNITSGACLVANVHTTPNECLCPPGFTSSYLQGNLYYCYR